MIAVADVLALMLVHHSLHRVGAFLALRQLLNKKKAVKISELWFEELTGCTHGPLWFRYTQAGIKFCVFAASIALSLSFNGSIQDRFENLTGLTILAQ